MRIVKTEKELKDAVIAAKREAKSSFDDDRVFLEKYIEHSRHIEVQILGDNFGGFKVLLIGSSLQCLALFLYLPFDGLTSLYLVSLIFGLAQGGIVPSYAVILREYLPPQNIASKIGIVQCHLLYKLVQHVLLVCSFQHILLDQ